MKDIAKIFGFINIGRRCVNSCAELRRLKYDFKADLDLLKNTYEIISNCNDIFNKKGREEYRELILEDLELLRISSGFEKANEVFEYRKKEIETIKETMEEILESNYIDPRYLNKAINFFEDLGDKCLSYSNLCSCLYDL